MWTSPVSTSVSKPISTCVLSPESPAPTTHLRSSSQRFAPLNSIICRPLAILRVRRTCRDKYGQGNRQPLPESAHHGASASPSPRSMALRAHLITELLPELPGALTLANLQPHRACRLPNSTQRFMDLRSIATTRGFIAKSVRLPMKHGGVIVGFRVCRKALRHLTCSW